MLVLGEEDGDIEERQRNFRAKVGEDVFEVCLLSFEVKLRYEAGGVVTAGQ